MTCPYCKATMVHDSDAGEWRCPVCDYQQWDDYDPATEPLVPAASPH